MHESLWRRWWWWWLQWGCMAAAVRAAAAGSGQGQCEVLDLSLQPAEYPLPTNLTLRPSVSGWQLNFTLQEGQAAPAACVRLKEEAARVQVLLYEKDCVSGEVTEYSYLSRSLVPPHAWTSLALHVQNKTVVITPPHDDDIPLSASRSLARHALQVTLTQDVEVAVGCSVSCPLHTHISKGVMKKVQEWRQGKLYFYFLPGQSFDKLHYEVACKQPDAFRRKVDISPGRGAAAGAWHLVQLEQRDNRAEVFLNSRLLEEILLPPSCTASMHVIWTVGDASFGFNCKPEAAQGDQRNPDGADPTTTPTSPRQSTDSGMGIGVAIGVAIGICCTGLFVVVMWFTYYRRKSPPTESQPFDGPVNYTSLLQNDSARNGRATPPGTQPTQAQQTTQGPQPTHSIAPQTNTRATDTDAHQNSPSQTEEALQTMKRTTASQTDTHITSTDTPDTKWPRSDKASQTEKLIAATRTGTADASLARSHEHQARQAACDKPQHTYPSRHSRRGTQKDKYNTWSPDTQETRSSVLPFPDGPLGSDGDKPTALPIMHRYKTFRMRPFSDSGVKEVASPDEEHLLATEQMIAEDSTDEA